MTRKVVIDKQTRVFDDFFKIDEFFVSHQKVDGTMSVDQRRLVFERGDAVAVLLLNLDTKCVVLVRQFRIPTLVGRKRDVESNTDGWITEVVSGMINQNETPEAAIVRETMEETGYEISNPKFITRFFSSPGGMSERIFLYFSEVREADGRGKGGGIENEDIEIVEMPLDELFDQLRKGLIEDPKLIVGAYWLLEYRKFIDI
jgi:nudix-type nucleoside diphosphatase (YffH/AdpP family)